MIRLEGLTVCRGAVAVGDGFELFFGQFSFRFGLSTQGGGTSEHGPFRARIGQQTAHFVFDLAFECIEIVIGEVFQPYPGIRLAQGLG